MKIKLLASLIIIVITLVVLIIFVSPAWMSFWQTKVDIQSSQNKIVELEDILEKTEEYKKIKEEADKVLGALPKEKEVPNLLVQFDTLAYRNNMILESIGDFSESMGSSSAATESLFSTIGIDLKVSGTYPDFKKYLVDLESNLRSIDVMSIDFGSANEGDIDFALKVNVYYR